MAKRSIQGYVELASGLGELTRSRAKEAAQEILSLAGSDASRKKAAKQVSDLADELLHAAQSNRKHLVRLVRREVESALGKLDVNRLSGDVQTLAATVAGLATQVDDMARSATGLNARTPGPVADALAGPRARARPGRRPSECPGQEGAGQEGAGQEGPGQEGPGEEGAGEEDARQEGTATKAPAKKAPAKKTPAKKAPPRSHREEGPGQEGPARSTAKKATATKAPARKAPAKKAATTRHHDTNATAPATTRHRPPRHRRPTTSTTPAAGA